MMTYYVIIRYILNISIFLMICSSCSLLPSEPMRGTPNGVPVGETSQSSMISFSKDIQPIFSSKCIGCHNTGTGRLPQALNLEAGKAYQSIVNINSLQAPERQYVVPSDSSKSFFFSKVSQDAPGVGLRMPLGSKLNENEITLIKVWIDQGAKNN